MSGRMPHGPLKSFVIEEGAVTLYSRQNGLSSHASTANGLTVTPLKIVRARDLPLSYCQFDQTGDSKSSSLAKASNKGTVYFHYMPDIKRERTIILDSNLLKGSLYTPGHIVLVKVNNDPKWLAFIQNVSGNLWILRRLNPEIRVKDIRFIDTVNRIDTPDVIEDDRSIGLDAIKSQILGTWQVDPVVTTTSRASVSDIILDMTPPSRTQPLEESLPALVPEPVIESITLVAERLKSSYLESLYLSQTPLSYFAKNTLSKIRNLVKTHNMAEFADLITAPTNDNPEDTKRWRDKNRQRKKNYKLLLHNLSSLVVDVLTLDEKYKLDANLLTQLADPTISNTAPLGFASEEFGYFKQWYTRACESRGGPITATEFTQYLNALKIREIQLQIIILLEILVNDYRGLRGGSPMATYIDPELVPLVAAPPTTTPKSSDHQPLEVSATAKLMRPRPRQLKPKLKKPTVAAATPTNQTPTATPSRLHQLTPDALIDIFFDRLCIWQAINTSTPNNKPNTTTMTTVTTKTTTITTDQRDELLEFCMEVIMPYYGSKLAKKTRAMLKKANGKTIITVAPATTKEPTKELTKELMKEPTTVTVPSSPVATTTSTSFSGNALPTIALEPIAAVELPVDTTPPDVAIPATTASTTTKSTRQRPTVAKKLPSLRGGLPSLTHQGLQRRQVEVSFKSSGKPGNLVSTTQSTSDNSKQDAVAEELSRAIRAISRPSRSIVAEETAVFHDSRLSKSGHATAKQQLVQVAQTPARGNKRVINMEGYSQNQQQTQPQQQQLRELIRTPSKQQQHPQIIAATPQSTMTKTAHVLKPRNELERIMSSPVRVGQTASPRRKKIRLLTVDDGDGENGDEIYDIDIVTGTPVRRPMRGSIQPSPIKNNNNMILSPVRQPQRGILTTPRHNHHHHHHDNDNDNDKDIIIPGTERRNNSHHDHPAMKPTNTPSKRRRQTVTPLNPLENGGYFTDDDNGFGALVANNNDDYDDDDFAGIFTNPGPLKGRRLFNLDTKNRSKGSGSVDL